MERFRRYFERRRIENTLSNVVSDIFVDVHDEDDFSTRYAVTLRAVASLIATRINELPELEKQKRIERISQKMHKHEERFDETGRGIDRSMFQALNVLLLAIENQSRGIPQNDG